MATGQPLLLQLPGLVWELPQVKLAHGRECSCVPIQRRPSWHHALYVTTGRIPPMRITVSSSQWQWFYKVAIGPHQEVFDWSDGLECLHPEADQFGLMSGKQITLHSHRPCCLQQRVREPGSIFHCYPSVCPSCKIWFDKLNRKIWLAYIIVDLNINPQVFQ